MGPTAAGAAAGGGREGGAHLRREGEDEAQDVDARAVEGRRRGDLEARKADTAAPEQHGPHGVGLVRDDGICPPIVRSIVCRFAGLRVRGGSRSSAGCSRLCRVGAGRRHARDEAVVLVLLDAESWREEEAHGGVAEAGAQRVLHVRVRDGLPQGGRGCRGRLLWGRRDRSCSICSSSGAFRCSCCCSLRHWRSGCCDRGSRSSCGGSSGSSRARGGRHCTGCGFAAWYFLVPAREGAGSGGKDSLSRPTNSVCVRTRTGAQ